MLKIRAVGLTVVNGKWSCDYTDQGMAARQRALDRGYRGSHPPQPRDQSLHRAPCALLGAGACWMLVGALNPVPRPIHVFRNGRWPPKASWLPTPPSFQI